MIVLCVRSAIAPRPGQPGSRGQQGSRTKVGEEVGIGGDGLSHGWGQRPYIIETMHSYTLPM